MNVTKVHSGHRQRLKSKVKENGLKSLSTHEVLELLLTYSIPYKDTNELAHELINHFGSLSNVLDVKYEELIKINGVGEETALFLTTMPSFFEVYKSQKSVAPTSVKNIRDVIDYFRCNYEIGKNESMYLLCLNSKNKILRMIEIGGISDVSIKFDIKYVTEKVMNIGASTIIICHTHPNGEPNPSKDDINTTSKIMAVCYMLGIRVFDHIVFNENNHYSFGFNGLIEKLYEKVIKSVSELNFDSESAKSNLAQNAGKYSYEE